MAHRFELAEGGLRLSFQRFLRPPAGRVAAAPASLGALPVGAEGDVFLLPVSAIEGFWVGLSAPQDAPAPLEVVAERRDGSRLVLAPMMVPPARLVAGLPLGEAFAVFDAGLRVLAMRSATAARLEIVTPASFAARTGMAAPDPPDPEAAYGGWRLP